MKTTKKPKVQKEKEIRFADSQKVKCASAKIQKHFAKTFKLLATAAAKSN